MNFKIVGDSCCDQNDELEEKMNMGLVPLKIDVEDETFIDDDSLDTKKLLKSMRNSKEAVKTSSPSPGDFMK